MDILLMLLAVTAFSANQICTRLYQLKIQKRPFTVYMYMSFFCLVAAIAYFVQVGGDTNFNAKILLFAMAFGAFFVGAILFSAKGFETGPMSLTGIILNSSVVITVLYSCIVYEEPIELMQIIGCALLFVTFILSATGSGDSNSEKGKANSKKLLIWTLFVFIAFFSNGTTAILQKEIKLAEDVGNGNLFMGIAYLTSAVIFFVYYIFHHEKGTVKEASTKTKLAFLAVGLISGLGSCLGNGIIMTLSTQVNAAVLYPCVNGGLALLVSIVSCAVFKEKLTTKKLITIIIGILSIIVLNL